MILGATRPDGQFATAKGRRGGKRVARRKNSGPIQRRAVQVLRDRGIISTTELTPHTHPRQGNAQDKSKSTRRALAGIAEREGRAQGMGRPSRQITAPLRFSWTRLHVQARVET